jgi:uncharacterized membrane protein (DUF373 family)
MELSSQINGYIVSFLMLIPILGTAIYMILDARKDIKELAEHNKLKNLQGKI